MPPTSMLCVSRFILFFSVYLKFHSILNINKQRFYKLSSYSDLFIYLLRSERRARTGMH